MLDIAEIRNTILSGHSLCLLKQLPSESVNCVVTSPPYWSLRDYGNETETIWDGDENCVHEWDIKNKKRTYIPLDIKFFYSLILSYSYLKYQLNLRNLIEYKKMRCHYGR